MKTDLQLQKDVVLALTRESTLDSSKIGVDVCNGIVTLAGYVSCYAEKRSADAAVQHVAGVRSSINSLKLLYRAHFADTILVLRHRRRES